MKMEYYMCFLKRMVKMMSSSIEMMKIMSGNIEMMKRVKEAAGYQRKAIRALMPERMGKHMDVIENEIKLMLTEAAFDILKECGRSIFENDENGMKSEKTGSKKIDIL